MTRSLVSGARPIPWEHLSGREKHLIEKDADAWIDAVLLDVTRSPLKPTAPDEIDHNRSGRVLFIDGPRGAGKTSMLLTLLAGWKRDKSFRKTGATLQQFRALEELSPILDFDPLPRGMPLHGWLLEPWRAQALKYDKSSSGGDEGEDLTEQFTNVFERAVVAWTQASVDGQGVVERATAYGEQASGWVETRKYWHQFVNACVCRADACRHAKCGASHGRVFVIAIDDVDLQVEHIPELLHAIRFLHHPNVAYVLTGDRGHLKFSIELDYIGRHRKLLDELPTLGADDLSSRIRQQSEVLSIALVEKALPTHATLVLPHFSGSDVLAMGGPSAPGDQGTTLAAALHAPWHAIFQEFKDIPITTARRAQQAMERHINTAGDSEVEQARRSLEFVADLCGTTLEEHPSILLGIAGRITTQLGTVLRAWELDSVTIVLANRPKIAFTPYDGKGSRNRPLPSEPPEAHQALLLRLAVENELAVALGLEWRPDAGILATKVEWDSPILAPDRPAIFVWPGLVRPTVSQVLQYTAVVKRFVETFRNLKSWNDDMVAAWLNQNIEWWQKPRKQQAPRQKASGAEEHGGLDVPLVVSTDAQSAESPSVKEHPFELVKTELKRLDSPETKRWVREVLVSTAPYFGLPNPVADKMREVFGGYEGLTKADVKLEERRAIENAILASFGDNETPKGAELDQAVLAFIAKQREELPRSEWWDWCEKQ